MKIFDWILISGIVFFNIGYSILSKEMDLLGSLAGITGVACVVLVAKGNIMNYVFGIVNVSLYAWISYKAGLYGDAVLNAVYYFPMQFIGWFSWIDKRKEDQSVTVVARRMNISQRVLLSVVCSVAILSAGYVLNIIGDPQPLKDAATTVLSVIAMFLMVRRFMEQWVLWVVVNIVSVIMWGVAMYRGDAHAGLMILMWLFYLANSINGWVHWYRLSAASESPAHS